MVQPAQAHGEFVLEEEVGLFSASYQDRGSTIDSVIDDDMSKWWIVDHRLHKRKDNNKQARRLRGLWVYTEQHQDGFDSCFSLPLEKYVRQDMRQDNTCHFFLSFFFFFVVYIFSSFYFLNGVFIERRRSNEFMTHVRRCAFSGWWRMFINLFIEETQETDGWTMEIQKRRENGYKLYREEHG